MDGKRILVMSPFLAWPVSQGAIVRTHHLVKQLAQRHRVWFAHRGPEAQQKLPNVEYITLSEKRFGQLFNVRDFLRLRRLVKSERIDVVLPSHLWSGLFGVALKLLTNAKFILDNHNVEFLRFRRSEQRAWLGVAALEFLACHSADTVTCVSQTDCDILNRSLKVPQKKLMVVENGADVTHMVNHPTDVAAVRAELGLQPEDKVALFFGTATYRPNAIGIDIILNELAPHLLPNNALKLLIVSRGVEAMIAQQSVDLPPNVVLVEYVEDIVSVIKASDCVIAPLTMGSGTRFKIIEGIACGKPIVSTTIGAEGLDQDILAQTTVIADQWPAFAHAIETVCATPRTYQPSPAFIDLYDWAPIVKRLELAF